MLVTEVENINSESLLNTSSSIALLNHSQQDSRLLKISGKSQPFDFHL